MSPVSTGKVVSDILAGRHDGKLMDIADAISARLRTDAVSLLWRIRIGDDVWDAETVTLGELREAEKLTNRSWLDLEPHKFMTHFAALVFAHYYKAHGLGRDEAMDKAEAFSQTEVLGALEMYEGSVGKGSPSTES